MTGEKSRPAAPLNRRTAGSFHKVYHVADLLDPDWERRVIEIESLASRHRLIPPVSFERNDDGNLHYFQKRVKREMPDQACLRSCLIQLAEELEQLSASGFIHGDINFKNLLFDGQTYRLIDLEPSLRQRRKGRVTLMYTPPYIARDDFLQDHLTLATDKIGFYFFCRRILNPIKLFSPMHEMQRIHKGHSVIERYTGLSEREFLGMRYTTIIYDLLVD